MKKHSKKSKIEIHIEKTPITDEVMSSSNWPWHITSEMRKMERSYRLLARRYELLRDYYEEAIGKKHQYPSFFDLEINK
jgi:hypothetical protein